MTIERPSGYCNCGCTCYGVFKEDVNIEGSGIKVYSYVEKPPEVTNNTHDCKSNVILESIIVTNVKHVDPRVSDFCKDIRSKLEENKPFCTICKNKFEQMIELLEELQPLHENHISAICQRCKLSEIECPRCKYFLTKFITNKVKEQDDTQLKCKERVNTIKEILRDNPNCRGVCGLRFLNNENIENFHKFPKIDSKLLSADKDYATIHKLKNDSEYNYESEFPIKGAAAADEIGGLLKHSNRSNIDPFGKGNRFDAKKDFSKFQKSEFQKKGAANADEMGGLIKHSNRSKIYPFGTGNRLDANKDQGVFSNKKNKNISNYRNKQDTKNKKNENVDKLHQTLKKGRSHLEKTNKDKQMSDFDQDKRGPGNKYNKSKGSKGLKTSNIGKEINDQDNKKRQKGKKSTKGGRKNDALQDSAKHGSNEDEPHEKENNINSTRDPKSKKKRSPKENENDFDEMHKGRKVKIGPEIFDDEEKPWVGAGIINYALSDKKFIDIGWTRMPPLVTKRRVFVFDMLPENIENNWFEKNKEKTLLYNTGEILAEVDGESNGNWYYGNGMVALSKDPKTSTIYENVEKDFSNQPGKVLAKFDNLGNGVVYGPNGDVRLQYNQFEGGTLDSQLSYPKRWQWHALNHHPPMKETELLEDLLTPPDPNISQLIQKYGHHSQHHKHQLDESPDIDYVKRIDIENSKIFDSQKGVISKKIVPFKIRMQALQINECFSLHIADQHQIFIYFRPSNAKPLKHNVGLHLDKTRIITMNKVPYGGVNEEIVAELTDKSDQV